jgi:hypothetical protein
MADLDPKGEGNNSMPGNRWPGPDVRDGASGGPRDMAKAGLPESQSPEDARSHPPEIRLKPAPCFASAWIHGRGTLEVWSVAQGRQSRR